MKSLVFAFSFVALAASAGADRIWLTPDRYSALHVVVAADADEPDRVAANRFVEFWRLSTGFKPDQSAESVTGAVNVWIGAAARIAFPEEFEKRRPSPDGFVVLTLPQRRANAGDGRDLLLAGGGPRGTIYAVGAFFERGLGMGVFAPDVFSLPDMGRGAPRIDYHYEPPFEYRDTNYRPFVANSWWASMNRLNGQWTNLPERLGGHIGFVHGLPGFGHTFHQFVNPDEYFDSHPEYFAEIHGERVKYSQLCLTNPDVLAITIDRARHYLREAPPDERILSISQMDYFWFDSWCTCDRCRAVDEEEGSHSGTIIRFVNAVADALRDEFPDALFDTFAYLYSRQPPKVTRPRDNVLIRVCAIEADYSRPLDDWRNPANRAFVRDLKDWRRVAKHLWVWDYTQNWSAFQAPHPNVPVLQPNLAFFRRAGVDGVFEQASPFSPHSDFELLKGYLLGRGLREPDFDWKNAVAEFLDAYYGECAPYIAEYQRLLQARLRAWGGPLNFVNALEWIDADTVERAQEIFARAFASTRDDELTARLRSAYLPVQYAALVCPPRVYQGPDAYTFTRPPGPTFEEYFAEATALGVTHLNDYPFDALRRRMKGRTPPRYEVAPIEKLQNDEFEIWIMPARGGAVVRWREKSTGRDWLSGYDDIRSTQGRLQVWSTSDEDRWAEPEPDDEPYTVVERGDGGLTMEIRLGNGLRIRKNVTLLPGAIETRLTLKNESNESIVPKLSVTGEFNVRNLEAPRVFEMGAADVALRFPGIGRTLEVSISPPSGPGDRATFGHTPRSPLTRLEAAVDRAPLAPGESRSVAVMNRISAAKPPKP